VEDELIVVDNGSTDGTQALVKAYGDGRVVLLHQQSRGTAAARNAGLRWARGRYVSFQDHDDLWPEGRQAKLLSAIVTTAGANAAHGRQRVIFDGTPIAEHYAGMDGNYVFHHSIVSGMFERSLLDRVGHLDETMGLVADVDYLVRLRQAGMIAALCDADVHIRRRHSHNSSSVSPATIRGDTLQIMRRNILRLRGSK